MKYVQAATGLERRPLFRGFLNNVKRNLLCVELVLCTVASGREELKVACDWLVCTCIASSFYLSISYEWSYSPVTVTM